MIPVPMLALGLGTLVAALWLTRKPTTAPAPPVVGRFLGMKLRRGQAYRLFVRSTQASSALRQGLSAQGWDVLLLTKDPSKSDLFSVLCKWTLPEAEVRRAGLFAILDVTPVEEPPPAEGLAPTVRGCDPGLTPGELASLAYALQEDINPKHLGGFASTFEPDYPAAASMLRVKSALVQLRAFGTEKTKERAAQAEALRSKFLANCKLPQADALWRDVVLVDPCAVLAAMTKGLGASVESAVLGLRSKLPVTPSPHRMWVLGEVGQTTGAVSRELVEHYALLPGETPEEKAKALREAPIVEHVKALRGLLVQEPDAGQKVRSLLMKLVKDGALIRKSVQDVASLYRVSAPVARTALACVIDLGEGGRLVNGVLLATLLPEAPPRPTPSALALASTTLRPTLSTVTDPKAAVQRSHHVVQAAESGDPEAKAARAQLGRAVKTLERAKWVRWYKKVSGR